MGARAQKKVQKIGNHMVVPAVFAHFGRFLRGQKYEVRDKTKKKNVFYS